MVMMDKVLLVWISNNPKNLFVRCTVQDLQHELGAEPEALLEYLGVCRVIQPVVALFCGVEQFDLFPCQSLSQRVVGLNKRL